LMSIYLISLRYYQVAQAKKQTHFYLKIIRRRNFSPRKDLKNHVLEV
jgi:hypothetical protein